MVERVLKHTSMANEKPQIIVLRYTNHQVSFIGSSNITREQRIRDMITVHDDCFTSKMEKEIVPMFPNILMFVLYDKDKPIGIVWLEQKTRDISYMTTFGIIKSYRRKRMGMYLFQFVRTMAYRMNSQRIIFDSYKDNVVSTAFYNSVGCKILDDTIPDCILWSAEPYQDLIWDLVKGLNDLNKYKENGDNNGEKLVNCAKKAEEGEGTSSSQREEGNESNSGSQAS